MQTWYTSLSDQPLSKTQRHREAHAAQHHSLHIGRCSRPAITLQCHLWSFISAMPNHLVVEPVPGQNYQPATRAQTQTVRDTESAERCACVSSRAMHGQVNRRCSDIQIKCSHAVLLPRSVIQAAQAAVRSHPQLAAACALHASVSPVQTQVQQSHGQSEEQVPNASFVSLPLLRQPRPSTL